MTLTLTRAVQVPDCPACHGHHSIEVDVTVAQPIELFGGQAEPQPPTVESWSVFLTCPDTKRRFSHDLQGEIIEGSTIVGINEHHGPVIPGDDIWEAELNEWIKASADTIREFIKMMISVTSGAIPLYFVVTNFLGFSKINTSWQVVAVIPPVMLLASSGAFMAALRPSLTSVESVEEFKQWRTSRFRVMDRWARRAIVLLWIASATATVSWGVLLWDR